MLPWSNQVIIVRNNLKIEEILILNFIKKGISTMLLNDLVLKQSAYKSR